MTVLVVTPRDDGASRRCATWADRLATKFAPTLSVRTTRSRSAVEALLRDHQHVLYFGHGERDALVVPRRLFRSRRALIDLANIGTAPGRIVVAVACFSGDQLARSATSSSAANRVKSYIGWLDEISWPPEWSDPIGDALVDGITTLLDGGDVGDCATAIRHAFDRAHDRYRNEGPARLPSDRVPFAKMCATYGKERIAVEGDRTATL